MYLRRLRRWVKATIRFARLNTCIVVIGTGVGRG